MNQLQQRSNIEVQPQFDAHINAYKDVLAKGGTSNESKYLERTKNRTVHARIPEEYCLIWHDRLRSELRHMRKLWEMYVTMHRRFRGVTISDQFGYFGTRPETQGVWIDHDPELDGEVYPINIVRPDIKANVAALLQINVAIDVEPANLDAKNRCRADKIQKLADFFRRDCWTESDRTHIFDGIHKEGVWVIENYLDREAGCDQKVPRGVENMQHFAVLRCPDEYCGSEGVKEIANDQLGEYQDKTGLKCPQCRTMEATSSVKSLKGYDAAEENYRTSEIAHRMWGGFNFLIDRYGAKRKGIQSAKYLQTMELVERAELEDQYPQFKFDSPFEWSYGLKCEYALANADWSLLYSNWSPSRESAEWDLFEKRTIMLHECVYRNYVAPQDWEFRGKDGEVKFKIERGQKWDEAVKECHGENVKGFRMVFVNERLIDIETPKDGVQPNFRKAFCAVHFQPDSGSFLSVPHWDSVQIQDVITLFNTLKTETTARNSVQPVWFNAEVFDIADFGKEYIPSKNGSLDAGGQFSDIKKEVWAPPTAKSADEVGEHLQFLLAIRREVSGVQPPMLGEPQKGQPFAAQRQQLQQSFMILNGASKSWSQFAVCDIKQKIQFAFETWTTEQFQAVASRAGEKWTEEDVAELVQTDLHRDVAIDYIPGSETPQTTLEKELKFWNGITQATPFLQHAMQAGILTPEVLQQILKRIDEFADFDFDLSGREVSDALAQKRHEQLAAVCEEHGELSQMDIAAYKQQVVAMQPVPDPTTGEPAIDEMTGEAVTQPITAFDLIVEELMMRADIYISPIEDVQIQNMYFVPEIVRELARPKPNYLLVELMTLLVEQFNQTIAAAQAEAMANDPEVNANKESEDKKIAAEKEKGDADRSAKKEDDEAAFEREREKVAIAEAGKENDRDFEREKMAHELRLREAEVGAEAGLALEKEKVAAADKKAAPKK